MTALVYFISLGLILVFTHGHFVEPYVLAVLGLHTAFAVREAAREEPPPPAGLAELLTAGVIVFGLFLTYSDQLIYPMGQLYELRIRMLVRFVAPLGALLLLALRFQQHKAGRAGAWLALAGLVGLLVWVRWLVLWASPQPHIDVWTSSVDAVNFFLDGKNPYTQQYRDIYGGAYDYIPSFPYLPGYLLWATGFAAIFRGDHDVRISLVTAELLTSGLLFGFLRSVKVERLPALIAVVLWLAWPIDLFVLEQAWIDPLLLMGFAAAAWALSARRWALAGLAFGFACAVKQYAAPGVLLALPYVWRLGGKQGLKRFALAGAGVVAVLLLPFLVASPERFVKYALFSWADALPRLDSMSFSAWLAHNLVDNKTPDELTSFYRAFTPVAPAALALTGWWAWKREATVRVYLAATGACYGLLFLFAKQAFCNYYYFLSFFIFAAALAPGAQPPAGEAPATKA